MGAITADKHYRESLGSLTLHIAKFTAIVDDDTWTSGIQGIVDVWSQRTGATADDSATGFCVSVSSYSTGAMTFTQAVAGTGSAGAGTIYVIAKN